jgi:hypothetical protein
MVVSGQIYYGATTFPTEKVLPVHVEYEPVLAP